MIYNGMLNLLAQSHQLRPDLSHQLVTYLSIYGNKNNLSPQKAVLVKNRNDEGNMRGIVMIIQMIILSMSPTFTPDIPI